ncbi:hypothetical protein BOM24_09255 [Tatumella sp. OPLPL6]|nr:hypothetical protein BOM24_09255 [Tatumella sp. OPLPL6]
MCLEKELSNKIKSRIKSLKISYEELSIQTGIPIATLNRLIKHPYNAKYINIINLYREIGWDRPPHD